ncbi:hypothetical protein LJR230_005222 [Trinickia sp. LjRoot230]|uniref:hypothetical protein n=1 Tax=Trinickia sp. LjRoot230 TaxID=3342288 RepID=UPI003ECCED80
MMLDALGQLARLPYTRALFRKADGAGPELSAPQQQLRLTMQARNVGRRPESEQITAFNDVLGAIYQLPRQDRWHPLECLAKQISALPEVPSGARDAAFRSVANAIDRLLAKHRVAPLTALASQVSSLPKDERLSVVDRVIEQAGELYDEHASDVLSALVRDFRGSRQAMLGLFERVEGAATSLEADHRAGPIMALAEKLVKLSQAKRPHAAVRLIDLNRPGNRGGWLV